MLTGQENSSESRKHESNGVDAGFSPFDTRTNETLGFELLQGYWADGPYGWEDGIDFRMQIKAVRALFDTIQNASDKLENEVKESESKKRDSPEDEEIKDHVNEYYDFYTYHHAANSLAYIGVLAPLVESLFSTAFEAIHLKHFKNEPPSNNHKRWKMRNDWQWDCAHTSCALDINICEGIIELSEAIGLQSHLPSDLVTVLDVLFTYRNRMLHDGMEWPASKRRDFRELTIAKKWPHQWFAPALFQPIDLNSEKKFGRKEPTIYCATRTFIEKVLSTVEHIVNALGAYDRIQKTASKT